MTGTIRIQLLDGSEREFENQPDTVLMQTANRGYFSHREETYSVLIPVSSMLEMEWIAYG